MMRRIGCCSRQPCCWQPSCPQTQRPPRRPTLYESTSAPPPSSSTTAKPCELRPRSPASRPGKSWRLASSAAGRTEGLRRGGNNLGGLRQQVAYALRGGGRSGRSVPSGEAFVSAFVLVCLDAECVDIAQAQDTRTVKVVGGQHTTSNR
jgi:hypothetical protein